MVTSAASSTTTVSPYSLVVSRQTVDHLGIKLYDRIAAVVAELLANAYDADATEVTVEAPFGEWLADLVRNGQVPADRGFAIVIRDNGHGMTPAEAQEFYLHVGLPRRGAKGAGALSRGLKRPVMGRKGIGKFAPFGVCSEVEIKSSGGQLTDQGYETSHFTLIYDDIVSEVDGPYLPKAGFYDRTFQPKSGTTVILRKFKRRQVPAIEEIQRDIASRFSLSGNTWTVTLKNSVTRVETLVGYSDVPLLTHPETGVQAKIDVAQRPVPYLNEYLPIEGWIGISADPYKHTNTLAGIRIFARGKRFGFTRDFDIASGFTGEHTIRSYLVGEIHADWLDSDEQEDIARSDRQDLQWASDRGLALQAWGQSLVRELARNSETSRRAQLWSIFSKNSEIEKVVAQATDTMNAAPQEKAALRRDVLNVARAIVQASDRGLLENTEYQNQIIQLALATGPHRVMVDKLMEASASSTTSFQLIASLFTEAQAAETLSMGVVAWERVKVITKLSSLISNQANEPELQKIIESSPWLIKANWTVLTMNQPLEVFRAAIEEWYKKKYGVELSTRVAQITKKPDFVLVNLGEQRVEIVEIKKPGHTFDDTDMIRLNNYIDAFDEFFQQHEHFRREFPSQYHITLVADKVSLQTVAGRRTQEVWEHRRDRGLAGAVSVMNWQDFLAVTKKAHEQFLALNPNPRQQAGLST